MIREHAPAPAPAQHGARRRSALSLPHEPAEVEAERAAATVAAGLPAPPLHVASAGRVHRQAAETAPAAATAPAAETAPAVLVVDDDAESVGPGQSRKGEFLDALHAALDQTVEAGFAGSQYEGRNCPMVVAAIDHYRRMPAVAVEASIRRWAPEAASARRAGDYVPLLAARVRPAVDTFVRTGAITGLPPELRAVAARATPGAGGFAGVLGGMVSGMLGALRGLGGLLGGAFGGLGGAGRAAGGARAQFAHRSDPVGPDVDPATVRGRLGPGGRLDSGVRNRMERAFGHDFSAVRVHTDQRSGAVAQSLGARALTVGDSVAFAPGEYRPGTPYGDAILAHELAHTIQQRGATPGRGAAPALEHDADVAAAGALSAVYGGAPAGAARPRATSGLRLQRCSGTRAQTATPAGPAASAAPAQVTHAPIDPAQWRTQVLAAKADGLTPAQRSALMTPLAQQALSGYGVTVRAAGESNTAAEDPNDYVPVSQGVNFDVRLNAKTKFGTGRSLTNNAGHSFTANGERYLVLGPRTLDEDTPDATRFIYEHERFHVDHHLGSAGGSDADHEVEAYADGFPRYFHLIGSIGRIPYAGTMEYAGEMWTEMIMKFEDASADVRNAALERLQAYYRSATPERKHLFDEWLRSQERRRPGKAMVRQLAQNLGIDLTVAPPPWQ